MEGRPKVVLETRSAGASVPLGQAVELCLGLDPADGLAQVVKASLHVVANGILHPRPVREWAALEPLSQPFWYFPEAPGRYSLLARVEFQDGTSGRARLELAVKPEAGVIAEPRLARAANAFEMWSPGPWEAQGLAHHESAVLRELSGYLRPGGVAYDVGANLGLFSLALGRLVGPGGQLYCIEANPVCLYFLRANLLRHGLSGACLLPLALSDRERTVEFSVNFDNSNLGVSCDSPFFAVKPGQRIAVDAIDMDTLLERFELRPPDCVKIDVEGAEASVVRGMRRTLSSFRPAVVAELHGLQAAAETLALLGEHGYRYLDVARGAWFADGDALLQGRPDAPFQVIAVSGAAADLLR
jgi:FkbM family methyltransferase